jgi:hypothetical protein
LAWPTGVGAGEAAADVFNTVIAIKPASAQIDASGAQSAADGNYPAQSGGSARGYRELSAPLAIPTTAEQVGGQAVCFSLSHKSRSKLRRRKV